MYLYQYLCREIERLAKAALLSIHENKKRWGNNFRLGCVNTISIRLHETRRAAEQGLRGGGGALVKREDEALRCHVAKRFPKTRPADRARITDTNGFYSGQNAGRDINLGGSHAQLGRAPRQLKQ